jgi:hypothetical protein
MNARTRASLVAAAATFAFLVAGSAPWFEAGAVP